jgi:DNA (cytosine-5)-methyltransferase 1
MGFEDTRGTLFYDVFRILREKKPKYFILENVKNLKGHDGGKTWAIINKCLLDSGYNTPPEPIVLSPHNLGIPQHRERVFIIGKRVDLGPLLPFPQIPKSPTTSIESILLPDDQVPKGFAISTVENQALELWSAFVDHFKAASVKLPTFPLWSDDWDSTYDTKDLPGWKQKFIKQNREFYLTHKGFLEGWLATARASAAFSGAKRKFEWQCGAFKSNDTMWNMLFQFRPSGIRVKRPTYSPALVAMAQIVIVGSKRRRLCPREVARLQSFPDTFRLPTSTSVAYKQFGNAVNVNVVKHVAEFLLK